MKQDHAHEYFNMMICRFCERKKRKNAPALGVKMNAIDSPLSWFGPINLMQIELPGAFVLFFVGKEL